MKSRLVAFPALVFGLLAACSSSVAELPAQAPEPPSPPPAATPRASAIKTPPLVPKATRDELVIFHGDDNSIDPRIEADVPIADQKRVFDVLFPRWLQKPAVCKQLGTVEEMMARGEVYPEIRQRVVGSFSAPGRQQTLYLLRLNECGLRGKWSFGTGMLALFQNGALVGKGLVEGWSGLKSVFDLEEDGREEIVFAHAVTREGSAPVTISVRLLRIGPGGIEPAQSFGIVQTHDCALLGPAGQAAPWGEVRASFGAGKPTFVTKPSVRGCE